MEAWRTTYPSGRVRHGHGGAGQRGLTDRELRHQHGALRHRRPPDIDDLFRQQAQERDRKKREALLHQIQRLMYDRVMYGGIFEPATLARDRPAGRRARRRPEHAALLHFTLGGHAAEEAVTIQRRGRSHHGHPARSRHRALAPAVAHRRSSWPICSAWPGRESRGEFTPVYVNESLTVDFADREQFQRYHLCFRVSDTDFDEIFGRIQSAGLAYRSRPRGENDMLINRRLGGKNVYWEDADGHLWEILTVSYARSDSPVAV